VLAACPERKAFLRFARGLLEDLAARDLTPDARRKALEHGASRGRLFNGLSAALGGWVPWEARPVQMPAPALLPAPVGMVVDEPVRQVERGGVKRYRHRRRLLRRRRSLPLRRAAAPRRRRDDAAG
jgi:hypothetical protein